MTLQQLRYAVEIARCGSITEAAKNLFITQPSISAAIHQLEEELHITLFVRKNRGVYVTPEGTEFLGYARQIISQTSMIEERYINHAAEKKRFSVSTQHYSFTAGAFVELVRDEEESDYEFILREGRTFDTIQDVRTLRSDLGVIYLSGFNETMINRELAEGGLVFTELFAAKPHIFLSKDHPLAKRELVSLEDLDWYPCLTYEQGEQNALVYSEEIMPDLPHARSIKVTDKGSIIDLMIGTNGYTISSGACPSYLHGDSIISIPLDVDETIRIGYITRRDRRLTPLAEKYLGILRRMTEEG